VLVDLGDYPGLIPGIVLSGVLGLILCVPLGRALGIASLNAWLLIFGFGIVIAATLTPSREALAEGAIGTGFCDLSRFTPPGLDQILSFDDTSLNVILFIPLGIAVGCVPPRSHMAELILLGATLPFIIEAVQLLVTQLDRACQSADVVDNLLGFAIGLVVGLLAAGLFRAVRWSLARIAQGVPRHE
jgi:VanZ like family